MMVVGTVDIPHEAIGPLRIDPDGFSRLEQPEHEIEIVGRFHRGWRQPAAAGDLLAETARQVPAHHYRHRLAQRAVGDLLLGVGDSGVEALRVADREFEIAAPGNLDQFVGLEQFECDRLFEEHMLAGLEAITRDRIMVGFGCGRNIDDLDLLVPDDVAIVGSCRCGIGQCLYLGQPVRSYLTEVQLVDDRGAR